MVVGYVEDGPNKDGPRLVTGRAADGEERDRLWSRWREVNEDLDAYAAHRSTETTVVVLAPRSQEQAAPANG